MKIGAEYKVFYKCRLCGETFPSGATAGHAVAFCNVLELAAAVKPMDKKSPKMLTHHHCDGHGIGLADFIGWKPTQSKEKEEA